MAKNIQRRDRLFITDEQSLKVQKLQNDKLPVSGGYNLYIFIVIEHQRAFVVVNFRLDLFYCPLGLWGSWKGVSTSPGVYPSQKGSKIGLAGCVIWLFFVVILEMRAKKRSGKWLGCGNRNGKVAGYGNQVLSWPHFDTFVYSAHVLRTTSRQENEACQFYPLSLLRVFVRERSMERSGVRPKNELD